MTISGAKARFARTATAQARALVIIAAVLCALPAAAATGVSGLTTSARAAPQPPPVPLTAVIVTGSTVYSPPQLFAAYRDQLGRPIARESARAIVNALADAYVRDGYVKPEIALDDALAARGVLRLQVFEAQIVSVTFEGDSGRFSDALDVIGARLENARPLRKDDVSRGLRDMRQIAGLAVTATTKRDPQIRNAFELVVQADFSPVDGVVRMNNRGTDQAGPVFMLGQVFANGLLGGHEKVGLIFAAATDHDEYLGGGLYVDTPLGAGGARGNALVFSSHSAPNEEPVNLDDEYSRQRVTLRVSKPLQQKSTVSLTASVGFEADDLTIDRAGSAIRDDRLRVLEGAVRAGWRAAGIQFSTNLQVRQGLDAFGAGLDATDLVNDPRRSDFIVTQMQTSAYRGFAERWSLRLDAFAQHSSYVLPDSERFKIGGDRLGRGFEVAEIAGDSGLGGKLELRRDLMNTESLVGRLSAYGFYDIGAAWKQDLPGRESAATAGAGFAIQGGELTGYLELAAPLTGTDVEGKRQTSVFAEISYRF